MANLFYDNYPLKQLNIEFNLYNLGQLDSIHFRSQS